MSQVRLLPAVEERVESGPIQFGDDWPGTFIRGDNSAYYAMILKMAIDKLQESTEPLDVFTMAGLIGLHRELTASRV